MNSPAPAGYLKPSNLVTYGSLLAGLLAVAAVKEWMSWNAAGGLIALSVLLDTFDGRFAARFRRSDDQRAFGIQLDSLADAVTFGFVPIVCLLLLPGDAGASPAARLGWYAGAILYLVGALTRLGCYNLHQAGGDRFLGVPTTLAALLLSALYLVRPAAVVSAAALGALAVAMVIPLPVPRPRGAGMVAFVIIVAAVIALHALQARG